MAGKNNEIAEVHPRPILFSKKTRITECSKKGCNAKKISKQQIAKLEHCNFEGYLLSDPDAKVSLVKCSQNGANSVQVISEKVSNF